MILCFFGVLGGLNPIAWPNFTPGLEKVAGLTASDAALSLARVFRVVGCSDHPGDGPDPAGCCGDGDCTGNFGQLRHHFGPFSHAFPEPHRRRIARDVFYSVPRLAGC